MKRYFISHSHINVLEVDTDIKTIKVIGVMYSNGYKAMETTKSLKYRNMRYKTGLHNRCINHLINYVLGYDNELHNFYTELDEMPQS
jgi:hypothetical protein